MRIFPEKYRATASFFSGLVAFALTLCFSGLIGGVIGYCIPDRSKQDIVETLRLEDAKSPIDVNALLKADSRSVLEMAPFVCKIARHRGITPADIRQQQAATPDETAQQLVPA